MAITQILDKPKLFVGDSNQNIFDFTNTNKNILASKDFFKEQFCLTKSFRSTPSITNFANAILDHSPSPFRLDTSVANSDDIKSVAYLTRTNSTILKKLYEMIKSQLPFDEYGKPVDLKTLNTFKYDEILENIKLPTIVRDIKLLFNGVDTLSSLMGYAQNGTEPIIKDDKLAWLQDFIYHEQKQGRLKTSKEFMSYCVKSKDIDIKSAFNTMLACSGKDGIPVWKLKKMIQTIKAKRQFFKDQYILKAHTSKGLEYDKVVLMNDFPNLQALKESCEKAENGLDFAKKEKNLKDEINL